MSGSGRVFSLLVLAAFLLIGAAGGDGGASVGVAGPEQVFAEPVGTNITSHLRVYNDGNSTGSYNITVEGNVSSLVILEYGSVRIPSGENRVISITYSSPEKPGHYEGFLAVSLEGEGLVPGVTVGISVTWEKPPVNRAPTVTIVSPKEGETLSGDVQVLTEGDDPDGDQISFGIFIDGVSVAQEPTYLWRTTRWSNGRHEVKVVVSDSGLASEVSMVLLVKNPGKNFWTHTYIAGVGLLAVLAAGALLRRARLAPAKWLYKKAVNSLIIAGQRSRRYRTRARRSREDA